MQFKYHSKIINAFSVYLPIRGCYLLFSSIFCYQTTHDVDIDLSCMCASSMGRSHTIIVLTVPFYLFFFLLKDAITIFFNYFLIYYTNPILLLISLIFNYTFHLPSSILTKLDNIYMFQYNKTMLFVASSFVE